ncbi:hypothetical protein SGI37_05245 [Providencia rettgeri]
MTNEAESLRTNSLRNISRALSREGAVNELFPAIKNQSLKKDDVDFLLDFFEIIKESFELFVNNESKIYEVCIISNKEDLLIRSNTRMEILFSFVVILRYFIEYLTVQPNGFYYNLFIRSVYFIKRNEENFYLLDDDFVKQLKYSVYEYKNHIFSMLIYDLKNKVEQFNDVRAEFHKIEDNITEKHQECIIAESKIADYKSEIDSFYKEKSKKIHDDLEIKEDKIIELKNYLENLGVKYNFAGLTKGYSDFYSAKNRERWISLFVLILLAFLSLVPLSFKLINETATKASDVNVVHYLGFTALTIIVLYFFRVSLLNYNSIKAELTQIKLRMNLCMFIDNYSDFSKSKDNREALEKFENIIFSNIQPNENNIPSTFDGLEQLASVIESITKRNK